MKDAYLLLGVPRNATQDEIRDAYLRCVRNAHPDGCPQDSPEWILRNKLMSQYNEAYNILRDPVTRQQHNRVILANEFQKKRNSAPKQNTPPQAPQPKPSFDDQFNSFSPPSNKIKGWWRFACLILLISGIGWSEYFQRSSSTPGKNQPASVQKQEAPRRPSLPPIPPQIAPRSGLYLNKTWREGEAPFQVRTSGTGYYFVKLVEIGSSRYLAFFIHAGETLEAEVPLGTYEMRYASGEVWYGEKYLFGPDTAYSKSDSLFDFRVSDNRVQGYTVTLYKVPHGNMRTHRIAPEEF